MSGSKGVLCKNCDTRIAQNEPPYCTKCVAYADPHECVQCKSIIKGVFSSVHAIVFCKNCVLNAKKNLQKDRKRKLDDLEVEIEEFSKL